MKRRIAAVVLGVLGMAACTDSPTPSAPGTASLSVAPAGNVAVRAPSTILWNRTAIALWRARGGNAGRINAYVSLAQYRAALAAAGQLGQAPAALAGAVAGASQVTLAQFYPLDVAAIGDTLASQESGYPAGSERAQLFAAGAAIGRTVGGAVLAQAASDNFGATPPPPLPVGAGYWVSSGAPIVRGGYGARPFFLRSGSELLPPPPPAFGSPRFLDAAAQVRAFSDTRTPAQVAITLKWVPFSGVLFNGVATDLIERYRRTELEATRILAYANAAAYDAIIGCFDAKFTYWLIRPTQFDPGITLATGLPNHPSYPSAHSCESGAHAGVLTNAFPAERAAIAAIEQEASMSRVYGGLHYKFDGDAGVALGRGAARLALERRGLE